MFSSPSGKRSDSYFILSPVFNPWFWIVIVSLDILTDSEVNPTRLINTLPVTGSLETFIDVETPSPTGKLDFNDNNISSPFCNSWGSVVLTFAFILSTFPKTWSKTVSNKYLSRSSSLGVGIDMKWTSSELISVLIPIVFLLFLTTKQSCGKLKEDNPLSLDMVILPEAEVNLTRWFVTNGWFSRNICFTGTFLVMFLSVKENVIVFSVPSAVPKPIVCDGLKNTFWFTLESK